MALRVVGDHREQSNSDKEDVLASLEAAVQNIKDGKIDPNFMHLTLVQNDIETLVINSRYVGRAVNILGYLDVAKADVLSDILE